MVRTRWDGLKDFEERPGRQIHPISIKTITNAICYLFFIHGDIPVPIFVLRANNVDDWL